MVNKNKTLVVNLFAGPGAGKSTGATYIFSKLKMNNVNAEYVGEFAKDLVWENNVKSLECQFYVTGNQIYRIFRCCGEVDVVITDSPILLGVIYNDYGIDSSFNKAVIDEFQSYKNLNYFVVRDKPYNPAGRVQTEQEAGNIDVTIQNYLKSLDPNYSTISGTVDGYDQVVKDVLALLK